MPYSNAEISSRKRSSDHKGTLVKNQRKGTIALWRLVVLKNHGFFGPLNTALRNCNIVFVKTL